MLLPLAALLRSRRPASRMREAEELHRRLRASGRKGASREVVRLAEELRDLKPGVLHAFTDVDACQGCGRGHSLPHGRWDGGFCCGGKTNGVFDDDEVAALALGGTRPRDLRAPEGDHAGCAFRGPAGCSLQATHRPTLCVRFACRQLEAELRASGDWERVRALTRRLEDVFRRFVKARRDTTALGDPGRR